MTATSTTPAFDTASAVETFVRGFALTRGLVYPCHAERIGPVWVVRDAPRQHGDYRNEEWITSTVAEPAPAEVHRLIQQHSRGRYTLCAICPAGESDTPLRSGYRTLGYRLLTTEPLMVHPLTRIPRFISPATIRRVTTQEMADRLATAAGSRQVWPEHLARDSPLRQYVALVDGEVVGWARTNTAGRSTWCSSMYVLPAFRRRGIARAMLCRMLRDDRAAGAASVVLLASHTGALLYPVVGYQRIGTLLAFSISKMHRSPAFR